MPLPDSYATAPQLVTYWKPLSATEQARATALLGRAATLINEIPGAADENGEPAFSVKACEHVSLDMVKRAMLSRGDGVIEHNAEMLGMSGTDKFVNPVGNLYLTRDEIARLKDTMAAGRSTQLFSLTPTSNARVPGHPWNYQNSSQVD
ncbi:Gp19/Gp15/Gp42 family protein [Arthrobacter sp. SLBN-53]|uniref:Gp19/Gp15/Gp42 family protein n=1 Tax=Arthrobacter sp. SLBN-53 TaxID=2768412 RepID=UPI0011502E29|nr:Gp19/Gp15/Gp42 family protein [Arthrobacter sp. SLBN-53]TQK29382.1 Gp19/Gp15/Gp42-like protein [Arthrobacter sp. SLBN-53]